MRLDSKHYKIHFNRYTHIQKEISFKSLGLFVFVFCLRLHSEQRRRVDFRFAAISKASGHNYRSCLKKWYRISTGVQVLDDTDARIFCGISNTSIVKWNNPGILIASECTGASICPEVSATVQLPHTAQTLQ